jgi:2-polyprenyl-6-methoxyphenol hydroxylase-like FAD-dependent oxidoreductase
MKKGVIIGAGIGGLTTAIALAKKGVDVKIYEQAPQINEVGAGIWVAPNGLKVYNDLGIVKEIIAAGKLLEKISIVDIKFKPIFIIDAKKIEAKHKFKTLAIHRATLLKILASYFPTENIHLNKKFKSFQHSANSIIASFEDGATADADFLISADGIKSIGRFQIHSALNLRYSGQTCWRFVTDFDLPKGEEGNMYEIWANTKGLRVGYSKINKSQVYVFITNFEKAGGIDNLETAKEKLLELCADFPDIVKNMIASANQKEIIRTDLFDFKPISNWIHNRVALIGDAAHATTPNLGQGACQAIEDAFVIAQQLTSSSDIERGFKNFQQKRIKKATFITNTSWQLAQMTNTSGLTKSIVKRILRMTPNFINEKQLDKIYSLDY